MAQVEGYRAGGAEHRWRFTVHSQQHDALTRLGMEWT